MVLPGRAHAFHEIRTRHASAGPRPLHAVLPMPAPRLSDNGHTVSLDLHGVPVHEAERLIERAARLAAERGRGRLTVVHGASTSSPLYRNRTIRHALYDLLDGGALGAYVTDAVRLEGSTLLALAPSGGSDPRPLSLADLRR